MTENNYKQKLSDLLVNSKLGQDQRLLWDLFLKFSQPDEDEAVYEAAEESTENLELLTTHLRDKVWEMKKRNKKAWKNLLAEEERFADIIK
ncbi:MAG: hypothetical protein ABH830_03940 [Patescibacteria group bacterium]